MKVYVFENASRDSMRWLHGFKPGDPLRLAYASIHEILGRSDLEIAEDMFEMLNRDDRPNGKVAPSMSVGDVVTIEDEDGVRSYAVRGVGFEEIESPLVPDEGAEERLERDLRDARVTGDIVRPPVGNEAVLA